MKKFSLLKKVCSAFVIISMIASIGMVAFAANPGAYEPADKSVKITDITYELVEGKTTLYNVTVSCEIGSDALDKNAIGVTMLTYAKKDASLSATAGDYTKYDESDSEMQIVGIDQKQREEGANTVEFTFAVTTDDSTGGYAVQAGRSAVILVSGDGLNPAAGLLTIAKEKAAATAASATASYDGTVSVYSYNTNEEILAALKENLAATVASVADADENELGTVAIADYVKTVAKKEDNIYTATAVIPADATVDSVDYNVTIPAGGLTVAFDFAVEVVAWEADYTEATFEVDQKITLSNAVDEDAIKALFVGKKIEVGIAGNEDIKAEVVITAEMLVANEDNPAEIAVDGVYTYVITVEDTADYTIGEAVGPVIVKATIVEDPTEPFDITAVELSGDVQTTYDGEEGETKEDIIAVVIYDLQANTNLKAIVKGANGESEVWNIKETTWAYDEDKDVFAAEIVKADDAQLGVNSAEIKVEVAITINLAAPAYVLGDINNDGRYNAADGLLAIRMGLPAVSPNHYDATDAEKLAADVNGDGRHNAADALLIIKRGLPVVSPNAIAKFPIED